MQHYIGIDIGGTKIAGAVFSSSGAMITEYIDPTPSDYDHFLRTCRDMIRVLEKQVGCDCSIGVGSAGCINHAQGLIDSGNMPFLRDKPFRNDLSEATGHVIRLANDANCIALAEAVDGAGAGFETVLACNLGTGVGGGYVVRGHLVDGPHGMTGEIGHTPMPYRTEELGPIVQCGCGQMGCVETIVSGPGLERLARFMTGEDWEAMDIGQAARDGDETALKILDRYYDALARAMVNVIHVLDPHAIVFSGSLKDLPHLYTSVPNKLIKYAYLREVKTQFLPAKHGPRACLRGAAWLWR